MTPPTESAALLHRASEIFADALELPAGGAREQFVVQACEQWPEYGGALAVKVRDLLARHNTPGSMLRPTQFSGVVAAALDVDATDTANAQWLRQSLGAYQIDALIARGGMGWVFKGHRADAVYAQDVAIKLVRDSGDQSHLAERFRAERQILASLEHPNIARLLDGGATTAGEPYLVMEYVDGEPITHYVKQNKLDIAARLALFRTVCAAVHFAHQRLVVHRDLKPSNIFVSRTGEVKLLDFGIAKVLETEASNATPNTIVALTPAYASPEQIKGETITTASDVYALGVLLFELLTGQSPYKSKPSQSHDLAREICDTEPERPSTVVGRRTDPDPHIVATHLKRLQRGLRGDLDNIVLMALRKEPTRRYASAEQLSEDVRRYMSHEPVAAHADSWRYRAGKFVARNRWSSAFAGLAALSLVAGIAVATHQADEARRAQARAEKHFASVRKLANSYLFDVHDAIKDLSGATPARELLVKNSLIYLDQLAAESDDAVVRSEVAAGYEKLADVQGAWRAASLGDVAGAEASFRRASEMRERLALANPADRDSRRALVSTRGKLSELMMSQGRHDEAIQWGEAALNVSLDLAKFPDATLLDKLNVARGRFSVASHRIKTLAGSAGLSELNQALQELTLLQAQNRSDGRLRRIVTAAANQTAVLAMKRGELGVAIGLFGQASPLNEANRLADPGNPQFQRMAALIGVQLAEARWRNGDIGAEAVLVEQRLGVETMAALARGDPKNYRYRADEAILRQLVADKLARLKRFTEAVTELDAAITILAAAPGAGKERASVANIAVAQQQLANTLVDSLNRPITAGMANAQSPACGRLMAVQSDAFASDAQPESESIVVSPPFSAAKTAFELARRECAR